MSEAASAVQAPRGDDDARQDPESALIALVQSEGFALFVSHVRSQWGNAAQIRKIKQDMASLPPSERGLATMSITGTADAVMELFKWPEEEIARLREQAAAGKARPVDPYFDHRRVRS